MSPTWKYSDPDPGDLERCLRAWEEHCDRVALKLATPVIRICRAYFTPEGQRGIELCYGEGVLARFSVTPDRLTLLFPERAEQVEQ
jgi:hypothetical protein